MARKTLVIALIFILLGLGLILYSDPTFRSVFGSSFSGVPTGSGDFAGSSIFQECRSLTNETLQQCLVNNGVTFSGFGGGRAPFASGALGGGSLDIGVTGIAFAVIGSLLVVVQIFKVPKETWQNRTI